VGGCAPPPALRAGVLPRIAIANDFASRSRKRARSVSLLSSLFFFSLSCAARFAEGDAREARGVAQRSREGAAGPTRPSPPPSAALADEGRR
jgi:hypothetical protein